MTKLEHDAWLAVSGAFDSIDGFVGGPDQAQAIGDAENAICDLLESQPVEKTNSKGILTSSPGKTHYADDATIRHIVELEAEVKKLREVLNGIRYAIRFEAQGDGGWGKRIDYVLGEADR
jgi:hypothetical protein